MIALLLSSGMALGQTDGAARRPPEAGWVATYTGGGREVVRVVHTPGFTLGEGESVHPQIPPGFEVRYDGVVRILRDGEYTFGSHGGARITVDGKPPERVRLAAGDHPVRVEYVRPAGPARLQLTWSSDAFPVEPIPPGVLGHLQLPAAAARSAVVERGRLLVQDLNCIACHRAEAPALSGRPGPDLGTVGDRAKVEWINRWLEDPRGFRSRALMPVVLREEQDRRDVATYLATLKSGKGEGKDGPASAEAVRKGRETFENVGCVSCHGKTGWALNGQGSKWTGDGPLAEFLVDPLATDRSGRMPSMLLSKEEAAAVAAFLRHADRQEGKSTEATKYAVDPEIPAYEGAFSAGDAGRGKVVFASAGCVNCHTADGVRVEAKPVAAKELARVDVRAGCLAAEPPAGAPRYGLGADDRAAIAAYVASIAEQPEVAAAPVYAYREHVQQFNCVACHTAEGFAPGVTMDGVPPLSIAGQKLRPEWIRAVLLDKQRVRPWNRLRMPHFGKPAEPVAGELVAVSGAGAVEAGAEPSPQLVRDGRRLVGKGQGSLSCITCHSYGNQPVAAPEQSRGPELMLMAQRLRPDWFQRWVREPTRIVPNTVMPSFFVGKSVEESGPPIDAMWAYFTLSKAMPVPDGGTQADRVRFELVAGQAPVVQRCYLDGADGKGAVPRAVAVGLPGRVSYVFDPEACQFLYAWSGGFLDMTPGWNGRGNSHGRRVGNVFYTAPAGPAVYVESLGQRPRTEYRGYVLAKDGVEILYAVDGVEIRERVTGRGSGIVRTFEAEAAGKAVYVVFGDDPAVRIEAAEGALEPVATPAGWDPTVKARALKVVGRDKVTVSVSIAPLEGGK